MKLGGQGGGKDLGGVKRKAYDQNIFMEKKFNLKRKFIMGIM